MKMEYPLADMEKGREAGTHIHRSKSRDGWCQERTDKWPAHIEISRREVEENLVRARREYENAKARLSNLEQIMKVMLSEVDWEKWTMRDSFTKKVERVFQNALGSEWGVVYEGNHDYDGGAWVAYYKWPDGEEYFQDHPGLEGATFEEAMGKAAKAIAGIEKGSSVERKPGEQFREGEGVTVVVPDLGGRFRLNGDSDPIAGDWAPYINVMGHWEANDTKGGE